MIESPQQKLERATAMADSDHDVLELQLSTLNQNITRVMESIAEMREELKKISVLEVNHTHHNSALGRAFGEIEALKTAQSVHHGNDVKAHSRYDKTIAFATGFVLAVSVFWTVFGVRMNSAIDEVMRASIEMKIHMSEDRVRTTEDVLRVIRSSTKEQVGP